MKILQILPTLSAGGAEGFVSNLGVNLAKIGIDVRFYLLAGIRGERGKILNSRLLDSGIKVFGAQQRNIRSPISILEMAAIIKKWRPDVVQANLHSAQACLLPASILSRNKNVLLVKRLADTKILNLECLAFTDRFYDLTIACSEAVAESFRLCLGKAQHSRLIVIPNGGLLKESITTAQEKAKARRNFGINSDCFVISHIGRFSRQKGHEILLAAFAKAFSDNARARLLLVGDGELLPSMKSLAADLGIADRAIFCGEMAEPWPALQAADLFCFPSRHEGLPNVLPEAASCGIPVLASNIPEICDIAPRQAWMLKPVDDIDAFANGMRAILENYDKFKFHATDAVPMVQKRFSIQTCAKKYIETYAQSAKTLSHQDSSVSWKK